MSLITINTEDATVNGIPYVSKEDRTYVIDFIEEQLQKRRESDIQQDIEEAGKAAVGN